MSGEGIFGGAIDAGVDAGIDSQVDRRADGFMANIDNRFVPGGASDTMGEIIDTGVNTFMNSEINNELNRFI
ncbi:unnamed protein product [Rotaria socialis]|uniref:Uncharacterized protein n=1 Tax=Rotaria socialis TaxID=392032 RepID=A0A821FLQ0_9BILA|nr:unnamed protein product [Rotaria socialis]CAF3659861.1 unnamed protein product [Rotaria socialis]CAF4635782.1 unnamed protein product [Rotaria socialis]CAF4653134.1 unnamed protein product [Rotaria socialis]